jgi:predicted Zn-dependent protease
LDRALSLVNAALKSVPNQPVIRETRGQILLRLKQYKEAIFDLEFALSSSAPSQPIHEALSQAYEAIGMVDLAQTHQELAKKSNEHR